MSIRPLVIGGTSTDPESLDWLSVRKKPVIIEATQISRPFTVLTIEGTHHGKAGDYLMRGVRGELYPCDRAIFEETYDIVNEEMSDDE